MQHKHPAVSESRSGDIEMQNFSKWGDRERGLDANTNFANYFLHVIVKL